MQTAAELETFLIDHMRRHAGLDKAQVLFILASPRTGSTLLYQLLANRYDFFYFSNFINDLLSNTPVLGAILDARLNPRTPLPFQNSFGKTAGLFGPSEASYVLQTWFGGGHPSEIVSSTPLENQGDVMVGSLTAIQAATGRGILIKNAWNCFRVAALAETLPGARFLWLRRDIRCSAFSDLDARYRRGDPQTVWNSATPSNYKQIQQQPYWKQVVEQQYAYAQSLTKQLGNLEPSRHILVWYEDLCLRTAAQLERVDSFLAREVPLAPRRSDGFPELRISTTRELNDDRCKILTHVEENKPRLSSCLHPDILL